ncbi:MAG: THUMP domain-containing protein, partial [Pseudomonadota bacterium]
MTDTDLQKWVLFVTAARGLEPQLTDEVGRLGATATKPGRGGVQCEVTLDALYAICLNSRLASRVLLPLGDCAAADDQALYTGCLAIDWASHIAAGSTLAVDFASNRSQLKHTRFGAQRVKDAIVDSLREARGERPAVDRTRPDCRINAYLLDNRAQLALDLGGSALHRRPWLAEGARPPLPSNVAAALLEKSGWPGAARPQLVSLWAQDGSLAIEASEMASGLPAQRDRTHWGFLAWPYHQPARWSAACAAARDTPPRDQVEVILVEPDQRKLAVARSAARAAGVDVSLHQADPIEWLQTASLGSNSLILATPLEDCAHSDALWPALGDRLKNATSCDAGDHSHAAVLVPDLAYGKQLGLRARKRNQYWIGQDDHTLLQLPLDSEHAIDREEADRRRSARRVDSALARGADALVNRIKKNQRTLGKWAKREGIACYRLYDADLPEYALAIDLYGDHAHIQEYAAPSQVPSERAAQRLDDA